MPLPPDEWTAERLREALRKAAAALGVAPGTDEIWGWEGRGLSAPTDDDNFWLRLVVGNAAKDRNQAWDGAETSQKAIPARVPRPRFHVAVEWEEGEHRYRTELYERIRGTSLSTGALPPPGLRLPDAWWASLRVSLEAITSVVTGRIAVRQDRLDWAMPQFLDAPSINTQVPAWTTAHGDIQWGNLMGPKLVLMDWEKWGLAPVGYDEACLYIPSLVVPDVADKVWQTFEPVLSSPAGHFSQLVVASEFLQGMARGNNLELGPALRRKVAELLP